MNTVQQVSLFFQEGSSDKEYHLQLVEVTRGNYQVNFQYGRRGSTLKDGTKTSSPVSLEEAQKIYDKVLGEKTGKGYQPGTSDTSYVPANGTPVSKETVFIPQLLNPIEEADIEKFLRDDSFGGQEKKDGRHQPINKKAGKITVTNKKGLAIGYPKAVETAVKSEHDTIVDAEAIGETFHAFDLLEAMGEDLRSLGYQDRYEVLTKMFENCLFDTQSIVLVPLAVGYKAKKNLYEKLKREGREGIVFKKLDAPYSPGKAHGDMWKIKFYSTVSARVAKGREGKRSIGMELLIDPKGKWIFMGNCTIPPNKKIPEIGSIVEIKMLYCIKGGSFYQPIYLGPRNDVDAEECLMNQVKYKSEED